MEFASRVSVVHGIKRGDLVHTHGWHLQYPRDLVHDADACESMLALTEVEEWHDSGLLVLRRVPGDNLLDELFILGSEFEGYVCVVFRSIAVLQAV